MALSAWTANRIGRKLILLIIAFSTLIALFTTGIQLFIDYRQQLGEMEETLDKAKVFTPSIAASVWSFDETHIRLALDALVRLPAIEQASITTGDGKNSWSTGKVKASRVLVRTYPLSHQFRGNEQAIGTLQITASLDHIRNRVIDHAITVLLANGFKTFIVAAFMLVLFRRLLTHRLEKLAAGVAVVAAEFSPSSAQAAPELARDEDEIDTVQRTFDEMAIQLRQSIADQLRAYEALRQANVELELDIAARRRAEAEVSRLNATLELRVAQRTAELEAANNELATFTYSVSHDLRAPLRRIEGFGQILEEEFGGRLDEHGHHLIERIRAGAHSMAEMIDAFLELARLSRGMLNIEAVDLSKIAEQIATELHDKDPQRVVRVDITPEIVVDGDRRLMVALMHNLLENAWKYSRQVAEARIEVGVQHKDGVNVIFVRDNGAGFDPARADRLFKPFSRLHDAAEFEGTGIGLATVQRILARHGGHAWAESAPGQGATFYFIVWEAQSPKGA